MPNDTVTIEVIFKRSFADLVRNLFVPKAKRFPRVATFNGLSNYFVGQDKSLLVEFSNVAYCYPSHKIARIKLTRN